MNREQLIEDLLELDHADLKMIHDILSNNDWMPKVRKARDYLSVLYNEYHRIKDEYPEATDGERTYYYGKMLGNNFHLSVIVPLDILGDVIGWENNDLP